MEQCAKISDSGYSDDVADSAPEVHLHVPAYSPAVEYVAPAQSAGRGIITVGDLSRTEESGLPRAVSSSSPFVVINSVIIEQLKSKKYTEFDLHGLLRKHNKDIVPLLMLDENGFNMLHQCIQQNRAAFLKVFQAHGYWADLIEQEVPRGSMSEFSGCSF